MLEYIGNADSFSVICAKDNVRVYYSGKTKIFHDEVYGVVASDDYVCYIERYDNNSVIFHKLKIIEGVLVKEVATVAFVEDVYINTEKRYVALDANFGFDVDFFTVVTNITICERS